MRTLDETQDSVMDTTQSIVDYSLNGSMNSCQDVETNESKDDGKSYLLIHLPVPGELGRNFSQKLIMVSFVEHVANMTKGMNFGL